MFTMLPEESTVPGRLRTPNVSLATANSEHWNLNSDCYWTRDP